MPQHNCPLTNDNPINVVEYKKEKDIFDRRKFVISLTYKGKMLIEEIFDKHAENTVEFFDDMKKNEKQELLALLLKLRSEK